MSYKWGAKHRNMVYTFIILENWMSAWISDFQIFWSLFLYNHRQIMSSWVGSYDIYHSRPPEGAARAGLSNKYWYDFHDDTLRILILCCFKNRNKNSKDISRQISRINHTHMFCSGVPAASCRTTDERDGQQSQWPDKSHFCELTLTQRVFCRLLLWFLPDSLIFVFLLKLWRRQ